MKATETVDELMARLEHPLKAEIEALRQIIKDSSPQIAERIKWNAPSYHLGKHDMAAFHLRETKYVHITFVFYNGDMIYESNGLLQGDYKDRRMAHFKDMADVKAKTPALQKVVREWVALIAKTIANAQSAFAANALLG